MSRLCRAGVAVFPNQSSLVGGRSQPDSLSDCLLLCACTHPLFARCLRFKETVNQKLRKKKTMIVGFSFKTTDIRDIEAVVTPMAIYS